MRTAGRSHFTTRERNKDPSSRSYSPSVTERVITIRLGDEY
jgi:hypothetical protein